MVVVSSKIKQHLLGWVLLSTYSAEYETTGQCDRTLSQLLSLATIQQLGASIEPKSWGSYDLSPTKFYTVAGSALVFNTYDPPTVENEVTLII